MLIFSQKCSNIIFYLLFSCLHQQSPWNQYFEDSELKKLIRQDVVRTFPEVEFFQSLRIRDLMVTVLFCYARQNPEVSYRQVSFFVEEFVAHIHALCSV